VTDKHKFTPPLDDDDGKRATSTLARARTSAEADILERNFVIEALAEIMLKPPTIGHECFLDPLTCNALKLGMALGSGMLL